MRFEDEPNRPYLDEYPFKRPYPYPHGSDLHALWCWAESIRFRRERDSSPYDHNETILRPWQSVEHALLSYRLDYPTLVDELRNKVMAAEVAYSQLRADWSDEASYQFDQRLGELSARILRATELIAEQEASEVTEKKADLEDSKADSPKKIPQSEYVLRAIKYVNDYNKKIAAGKAPKLARNAILSMHLDKPTDCKAVKNLGRQLRKYRHLIRNPADSKADS